MKRIFFWIALFLMGISLQAQDNRLEQMHQRARQLISQMTLKEKIDQLMNATPGIERLGILPYNYWSEALHGVARNGRATVFPEPIGLGATFDPALVQQIGNAVSDEGRAKYQESQRLHHYGIYAGLTYWAPNINIFRDPRWGRGMETYGEDPFLTGCMGSAYVRGIQGSDPVYLKAAACAKHFAVHSGPEKLRHSFDVSPSQKDLWETYLPAFRTLVQDAKVEIVMGAYNRVYGESASGSKLLLLDILRDKWGFQGHVTSDCGAVSDIAGGHRIAKDLAEAAAIAIKNGMNTECGDALTHLDEALERGLVTEADLDKALEPLLVTRLKLGILGNDPQCPYNNVPLSTLCSPEHDALALKAAEESMVLLKNSGVLPLDKNIETLFVIGANAADVFCQMGNYYGVADHYSTFLEGISHQVSAGTAINYKPGYMQGGPNRNAMDWSIGEARGADVAIVVIGLSGLQEGEEGDAIGSDEVGDRSTLSLPEQQMKMLRQVGSNRRNKVVTVVTGGSPVDMREINELSDAVVLTWYPGQEGGMALGNLLFGDANFSGRLPLTFPTDVTLLPPYEDYSMQGRTYKYMTGNVMYPFGYGLSYSRVSYDGLSVVQPKNRKREPIRVSLNVKNDSEQPVDETVQLYLSTPQAGAGQPLSSLIGFQRVTLGANESRQVKFDIAPSQLETVQQDGSMRFVKGEYTITVSAAAPGSRSEELGVQRLSQTVKLK